MTQAAPDLIGLRTEQVPTVGRGTGRPRTPTRVKPGARVGAELP